MLNWLIDLLKDYLEIKVTDIIKEHNLKLFRYSSGKTSTLGLLYLETEWLCYTLEDRYNEVKIKGDTRIPAGRYEIKLRTEGGMHQSYLSKFGKEFHKGMLWLQNVDNFEYVYIHYGNYIKDTLGCILTGNGSSENLDNDGMVSDSVNAYKRVYERVIELLENGDKVFIDIKDNIF